MIRLTLTAYNMPTGTSEAEFDAWSDYVAANLSDEPVIVEMAPFADGGPTDVVEGATEGEEQMIREALASLWEAWCALPSGASD